MNLHSENTGVRLNTAISDQYVRQLIMQFAPDPLWAGTMHVDFIGELDIRAELLDYQITEVRSDRIICLMDMKIVGKKRHGLIKSSFQIQMKIDLEIILIFEEQQWTDVKIHIIELDILENSKIKIGLISFSPNMVEGMLGKLKGKIEDNIQTMIDVPVLLNYLSKTMPNMIPIMESPKIFFYPNLTQVRLTDLAKVDQQYVVRGSLSAAVRLSDQAEKRISITPVSVTNTAMDEHIICPVHIDLGWSRINQLINSNLANLKGLPKGVSLNEVQVSRGDDKTVLVLTGDIMGIDQIILNFSLRLHDDQLDIEGADIVEVKGNFLAKNLLKASEDIIIRKLTDVINMRINELIQHAKEQIYQGLKHEYDHFYLATQADQVSLMDLRLEDNGLIIYGQIINLKFLLAD